MELILILLTIPLGIFFVKAVTAINQIGDDFQQAMKKRDEFDRYFNHVMKYGTDEEKKLALLAKQNQSLEDLKKLVILNNLFD